MVGKVVRFGVAAPHRMTFDQLWSSALIRVSILASSDKVLKLDAVVDMYLLDTSGYLIDRFIHST